MPRKLAAQRLTTGPQRIERLADRRTQLGDPSSPYLTAAEAARYLRFPSVKAFYKWRERHAVPCRQRGRALLFDRRALDLAIAV